LEVEEEARAPPSEEAQEDAHALQINDFWIDTRASVRRVCGDVGPALSCMIFGFICADGPHIVRRMDKVDWVNNAPCYFFCSWGSTSSYALPLTCPGWHDWAAELIAGVWELLR
jgi:hypothetical protein